MAKFNPKFRLVLRLLALIALALSGLGSQPALAAGPWYVAPTGNDGNSCTNSSSPCATIGGAIVEASSDATVYVAVGTYMGVTSDAVVMILNNLDLSGGWDTNFATQTGMSIIDGQGVRRGIDVEGATVTVKNFEIQHGYHHSRGGGIYNSSGRVTLDHSLVNNNMSGSDGGGIYNYFQGILTLNNTSVMNNSAGNGGGGGITSANGYGTVTLNNSVVSGNSSFGQFPGSAISTTNTINLNNSTVSGNTGSTVVIYSIAGTISVNSSTISNNQGVGIDNYFGTVTLQDAILADNTGIDCYNEYGTITSLGYNLIESYYGCTLGSNDITNVDPQLGSLQDNGGPTLTQALQLDSLAINAGNPAGCSGSAGLLSTDQRGFARVGRCDIGAYESQSPLLFSMAVMPTKATPGALLAYKITLKNSIESEIDDVSLSETFPNLLIYQGNSLTASAGVANYSAGIITWIGNVNAGSSVTITFKATIYPGTIPGSFITNTATIGWAGVTFTFSVTVNVVPFLVFLPVTLKPSPGIDGRVTLNGFPASGIVLNLLFYNGTSWSILTTNVTSIDGTYLFEQTPQTLSPGQAYCVRFVNYSSAADGRLAVWFTRVLTSYTADQRVNIGDFDIADVPLVSPGPGTMATLPATFQWTPRNATPGDSYQFELFDPNGSSDFYSPLLGYSGSYTLNSLPAGFATGTPYGWTVWVTNADGSYGASFYYNPIAFSNSGSLLPDFMSTKDHPKPMDSKGYPNRRLVP